MAGYAYFDGTHWVEGVTGAQIKALAAQGIIAPSTLIRMPNEKEVTADKITGLEFGFVPASPQNPEPPQPELPRSEPFSTPTPVPVPSTFNESFNPYQVPASVKNEPRFPTQDTKSYPALTILIGWTTFIAWFFAIIITIFGMVAFFRGFLVLVSGDVFGLFSLCIGLLIFAYAIITWVSIKAGAEILTIMIRLEHNTSRITDHKF